MSRILVIEDEPTLAMALEMVLCEMGHDVDVAEDGLIGIEATRREPSPDLVLLDLFMPRMNGRQFLREIRSDVSLNGISVVLLTGAVPNPHDMPPEDTYQAIIGKPFNIGDLLQTIETVLQTDPSIH